MLTLMVKLVNQAIKNGGKIGLSEIIITKTKLIFLDLPGLDAEEESDPKIFYPLNGGLDGDDLPW